MLGDILLCPTFLPMMLHHLNTFLPIVANSRWSALAALIAESDGLGVGNLQYGRGTHVSHSITKYVTKPDPHYS